MQLIILATAAFACAPVTTVPSSTLLASATPISPSPRPTSSPATTARGWTELRWSQSSRIPDDAALLDVVVWHDGYVAVGEVVDGGQHVGAAFISTDAAQWQRTSIFPAIPSIVATATGLLAIVNRLGLPPAVEAWTSLDGRSWQRQEALALVGATIGRVAARGTTVVAIGTDASARGAIWRSEDGTGWSQGPAPSPRAIVRSVSAVSDGFVAVGRDGEPDSGVGVGVPGVGRPAAWWSSDGRAWATLQVEGVDAAGAQLSEIFRVADGFFAIGSDTTTPGQSARSPLLWVSVDARDWRLIGPPPHWGLAGANGQQAVVFAYAGPTANPEAWVSRDGRQWTQLALTGNVTEIPVLVQFVGMSGHIDRMFVMPRGVMVIGQVIVQRNSHLATWFAEAVVH